MSNVIMRPVYNRPEMLYLSLEYEYKARLYYKEIYNRELDLKTLFIVEHGSDEKTLELVTNHPFDKEVIFRDRKYGLTPNILEGMKSAFYMTDKFVIYIEDDILIHKTYFEYVDAVYKKIQPVHFSIISPYSPDNSGDVHHVRLDNRYAALAPLINKEFYKNYIFPLSTPDYYNNRSNVCIALNRKYQKYWGNRMYKYSNDMHNEQAGLINRLIDVAIIEEGMYMLMPTINRQRHIGYFGKNRRGGTLPGNSFDERLDNLREIIEDTDKMVELSGAPQYKDYLKFSEKLVDWNPKTLYIDGYGGTAK